MNDVPIQIRNPDVVRAIRRLAEKTGLVTAADAARLHDLLAVRGARACGRVSGCSRGRWRGSGEYPREARGRESR